MSWPPAWIVARVFLFRRDVTGTPFGQNGDPWRAPPQGSRAVRTVVLPTFPWGSPAGAYAPRSAAIPQETTKFESGHWMFAILHDLGRRRPSWTPGAAGRPTASTLTTVN